MNNLNTRQPAVVGLFYPGEAKELYNTVQQLHDQQKVLNVSESPSDTDTSEKSGTCPKALIVPHAGYIYSGSTAAAAFETIIPFLDTIKHVVIIGPAHRVYLNGLGLPSHSQFLTPLGQIPINKESVNQLLELPYASTNDDAHKDEHCLEVQLPFLQYYLKGFSVTPIVVGRLSAEQVSQTLQRYIDEPNTLILISSDLSHFLPYESAQIKDRETCEAITSLSSSLISEQACGHVAINGLTHLAQKGNYKLSTLAMCNSGDTAGDKDRVVGYGAWRMD